MEEMEGEEQEETSTSENQNLILTENLMNENLFNTLSREFLKKRGFNLPSDYKDLNINLINEVLKKSLIVKGELRKKINNVARFIPDIDIGDEIAKPLKIGAVPKTINNINDYNIMVIFNKRIQELQRMKVIATKQQKGSGVILFNNSQQLVSRLELLAGSIIAGNNGVKQEFSQIAHLLHQLKIISKKTLNDLLKKYILLK